MDRIERIRGSVDSGGYSDDDVYFLLSEIDRLRRVIKQNGESYKKQWAEAGEMQLRLVAATDRANKLQDEVFGLKVALNHRKQDIKQKDIERDILEQNMIAVSKAWQSKVEELEKEKADLLCPSWMGRKAGCNEAPEVRSRMDNMRQYIMQLEDVVEAAKIHVLLSIDVAEIILRATKSTSFALTTAKLQEALASLCGAE